MRTWNDCLTQNSQKIEELADGHEDHVSETCDSVSIEIIDNKLIFYRIRNARYYTYLAIIYQNKSCTWTNTAFVFHFQLVNMWVKSHRPIKYIEWCLCTAPVAFRLNSNYLLVYAAHCFSSVTSVLLFCGKYPRTGPTSTTSLSLTLSHSGHRLIVGT